MKKLLIIYVALIIATSYKAIGQRAKFGSIEGFVYDQASLKQVVLYDVFLKNAPYKTRTDTAGHFLLDSIVAGKYTFCVLGKGYNTLMFDLEVKAGVKSEQTLYLKRAKKSSSKK